MWVRTVRKAAVSLSDRRAPFAAAAAKAIVDGCAAADDYLVNHSSTTFPMGPDGSWKRLFPHGTDAAVMAAALDRHAS